MSVSSLCTNFTAISHLYSSSSEIRPRVFGAVDKETLGLDPDAGWRVRPESVLSCLRSAVASESSEAAEGDGDG